MNPGLAFLIAAMFGTGILGLLYKGAQRAGCRADAMTIQLFFWGSVLTLGYFTAVSSVEARFDWRLVGIATGASMLSTTAVTTYQKAFQYGKVAPSALIMNLSMLVPFTLSVIFFHEKIKPQQWLALVLMGLSLYCLWLDKAQQDKAGTAPVAPAAPATVVSESGE
jgi:drug/metabolite transporter (DMT)-like permease